MELPVYAQIVFLRVALINQGRRDGILLEHDDIALSGDSSTGLALIWREAPGGRNKQRFLSDKPPCRGLLGLGWLGIARALQRFMHQPVSACIESIPRRFIGGIGDFPGYHLISYSERVKP